MWTRRRTDEAAELDRVAAVVAHLAALLSAGVPEALVWTHVTATESDQDAIAQARDAAHAGRSVSAALAATPTAGWSLVAAAWATATELGAPLAPTLRAIGIALSAEAQVRREVATALAGPIASARLLMVLPGIALGLGLVLGFDTLSVLITQPIGWIALTGGTGLMASGLAWIRSLVRRAGQGNRIAAGIAAELHAVTLATGVSLDRASRAVHDALERFAPTATPMAVGGVAERAAAAGAPVADMLRLEAARERDHARSAGLQAAARLGVRLNLPLGVCILPAFILLGVVPLLSSVFLSTLTPLGP